MEAFIAISIFTAILGLTWVNFRLIAGNWKIVRTYSTARSFWRIFVSMFASFGMLVTIYFIFWVSQFNG